jgi:hypothetical protein
MDPSDYTLTGEGARTGALNLVVNLPGYPPLELNLPNMSTGGGASAAASQAPVLFTIADGDTLDVQIHGMRVASNLGDVQPEQGKRFLVLDVSLVNKGRSRNRVPDR